MLAAIKACTSIYAYVLYAPSNLLRMLARALTHTLPLCKRSACFNMAFVQGCATQHPHGVLAAALLQYA
jgi:hypothetical protein